MKKILSNLKLLLMIGALGTIVLPTLVLGARTATVSVGNLFPSGQLFINMAPPVATFPTATTTGSVYAGQLYFEVTALDGAGGQTSVSNLMGTTSPGSNNGYNITWPAVQGSVGYRVYFSTSTPLTLTQYFIATTTNAYDFTSTSSPVFIPAGIPQSNTAYTINYSSTGNSWNKGGNEGIGTSTPGFLLTVANQPLGTGAVATTTIEIGDQSTTTSRTCFNVNNAVGTAVSFYVGSGNTLVVEANKCR